MKIHHGLARWLCPILVFAVLLGGCKREEHRVAAPDYDAFWLWSGVKHQAVLDRAQTIYILQGEIRAATPIQIIAQRAATPHVRHARIWIVYRTDTLDWRENVIAQIRADLTRWRAAGNDVAGVQIDFDAATRGLPRYGAFLKHLRSRLPADCALSITGLLDWSSRGDARALNALAGVVDELVLQTYQGRGTIAGYEAYMDGLSRLTLPFKIGLVQGGEWRPPPALAHNPNFRGYVVFLLNKD